MSDYYGGLDRVAQDRYKAKLHLLGLDVLQNPYDTRNACNFVDDMTKWPRVKYDHIFCYYIERPEFTHGSSSCSGRA